MAAIHHGVAGAGGPQTRVSGYSYAVLQGSHWVLVFDAIGTNTLTVSGRPLRDVEFIVVGGGGASGAVSDEVGSGYGSGGGGAGGYLYVSPAQAAVYIPSGLPVGESTAYVGIGDAFGNGQASFFRKEGGAWLAYAAGGGRGGRVWSTTLAENGSNGSIASDSYAYRAPGSGGGAGVRPSVFYLGGGVGAGGAGSYAANVGSGSDSTNGIPGGGGGAGGAGGIPGGWPNAGYGGATVTAWGFELCRGGDAWLGGTPPQRGSGGHGWNSASAPGSRAAQPGAPGLVLVRFPAWAGIPV